MRKPNDTREATPHPGPDPHTEALIAAMGESMVRFEETYRLLASEALSDDRAG